jgi:hypothetical protein
LKIFQNRYAREALKVRSRLRHFTATQFLKFPFTLIIAPIGDNNIDNDLGVGVLIGYSQLEICSITKQKHALAS